MSLDVTIECAKGVLNILQHQIVAVLLFYCIWTPIFTYPSALAWHVALCTIGVFPLAIEGLAVLGYNLIYAIELEEKTRGYIHGAFMSLGTLFIMIGAIMEMSRDRILSHFSTSHGILGLVCLIFMLISFILGFGSRFAKALKGYAKPVIFQLVHNIVGIITFILAIACICTGFYSDFFISLSESKLAATIVTSLLTPCVLVPAMIKLYKQIGSFFESKVRQVFVFIFSVTVSLLLFIVIL